MSYQKSQLAAQYAADNNMTSVLPSWPITNLFPAYTISYSAATGKPIENRKKTLMILFLLIVLLITSLAASLMLVIWYFNAIQSNSNLLIDSNKSASSFHTNKYSNHGFNAPNHIHHFNQNKIKISTKSTFASTTTTTTTNNPIIETETTEDDSFGEKDETSNSSLNNNKEQTFQPNKDDEQLINFYKNFKKNKTVKAQHEEKLDGEFVEHHTLSDLPDDELSFTNNSEELTPISNFNNSNSNNENKLFKDTNLEDYSSNKKPVDDLNLPGILKNIQAKQFCNSITDVEKNAFNCNSDLNPNLISSYFCNDKYVIVAKINALKENHVNSQTYSNKKQLISKYNIHIERVLKRSPLFIVAFKRQELTTNVTINLSVLENELSSFSNSRQENLNIPLSCFGQPLQLKLGQTYLLSGRIFGLSAVSGNCDVQLEWFNDLNEEQRNQLIAWSTNRTSFSHC